MNNGNLIPVNNLNDSLRLYQINVNSNEFKDILGRLYRYINNMAIAVNLKETGHYDLEEVITGKIYPVNPLITSNSKKNNTQRNSFRKFFITGPLPNAGVLVIPHNIPFDERYTMEFIDGAATDPVSFSYIKIPNPSPTRGVEIFVDGTNITLTTTSNLSSYTIVCITLEYLKE